MELAHPVHEELAEVLVRARRWSELGAKSCVPRLCVHWLRVHVCGGAVLGTGAGLGDVLLGLSDAEQAVFAGVWNLLLLRELRLLVEKFVEIFACISRLKSSPSFCAANHVVEESQLLFGESSLSLFCVHMIVLRPDPLGQ